MMEERQLMCVCVGGGQRQHVVSIDCWLLCCTIERDAIGGLSGVMSVM